MKDYKLKSMFTLLVGVAGGCPPPIKEYTEIFPSNEQEDITAGLRGHH